jgi:hypothetical protein
MKENEAMNELILDDELINDFEFAERLYNVAQFKLDNKGVFNEKLFWEDFV